MSINPSDESGSFFVSATGAEQSGPGPASTDVATRVHGEADPSTWLDFSRKAGRLRGRIFCTTAGFR
jgi:hypothetical protein